jgi:hypothetical protein
MKKLTIVLTAISLVLVQFKCSRTSDIIGPDACPKSNTPIVNPFVLKNNSNSSTTELDLVTSFAKITATFSENISYKLVIKGQPSGAEYILESAGLSIDLDWYGTSTNGTYFEKNDVLQYKLTNLCIAEPLAQGSINLTTNLSYAGFGLKVVNFEDSPAVTVAGSGAWLAGACADGKLMTPATAGYMPSPQGGNYFQYKANCPAAPLAVSWYFGEQTFTGIASQFPTLGTDPTKVYLNFFAKGKANSQAQMIITEDLGGAGLTRKFLANVSPDQWKLYSVKLSDIGVINPSKISSLALNLGAAAFQDSSCQVDLDLVIFTFDKPF